MMNNKTIPIPYTGRRRKGHYYRPIRSASVKRGLLAIYGNLRGIKVPPNSWDDYNIAANYDRTWKRHRLTQWRPHP